MNYPALLTVPCAQPGTEEPVGLLAGLGETRIALGIAERHIRLWRANSEGHTASRVPSYVAHEALYEAGRAIDRIAEILRTEVEATGALRTSDHSLQAPSLPAHDGHIRPMGCNSTAGPS